MAAPLPKGFDPVAAGRLGLWLLGKRNHKAAQQRVAFPNRVYRQTLVLRFVGLICPWYVSEYPGSKIILGAICGIGALYARNLLKPGAKLPPKHARKMAEYLTNHASQCEALAAELRAYAAAENNRKFANKPVDRRKRRP